MEMAFSDALEWASANRSHYLTDVQEKVLWEDKKTGAKAALIKFPVGIADKRHYHDANQQIYGLSGEFEGPDGQKIPATGLYGYFQKGEVHGQTKITKESIILFIWDGSGEPIIAD